MDELKNKTSGDILNEIRKSLGFRQREIVGNEVTRNLVSLIENNKVALNKSTANILIRNMNILASERHLGITLDEKDLFIPGRFEAKKVANNFIEKLKKGLATKNLSLEEYIGKINLHLFNWDLPEQKNIIFSLIGDLYVSKKEYYKGYTYYVKSFESAIRLEDPILLGDTAVKITRSCIWMSKYNEAIEFGHILDEYIGEIPNYIKEKILFNRALAYKYLHEYDSCICEIVKIEKIIDETNLPKYLDLMTLKAICYKNKEMYYESLGIHNMLLSKIINNKDNLSENELYILSNILEIQCILKDMPKVLESIDRIIPLLNRLEDSSIYQAQLNLEVALAYKYLEDYTLAEKYFLNSIKYAKSLKDLESLHRSINSLVDIYIIQKSKNIGVLKNEIFKLMEDKLLDLNDSSIFQIAVYYSEVGDYAKVNEITKQLLRCRRSL
jgi:tetratricopeptide (TPR) repeat protein